MRIGLAIRAFFRVLLSRDMATEVERLLRAEPPAASTRATSPSQASQPPPPAKTKSVRNDAITLLATLQREARFVDIVQEPLADYSDAQIGAAARDVLRDCGQVLDRLFGLKPVIEQEEGTQIETPAKFDPGRYRVSGNVSGEPPYCGPLAHHGWEAIRCELPQWSGSADATMIVSPVELEVK